MRPPHRDMVEVDLGAPAEEPEARGRRRVPRRGAAVAAAAVAVVLAAAVGTRVLDDRREAAALAGYSALPGVSESLRHPLTETFRLRAGRLLAVDGDTVLARGQEGGPDLVALDARSGAQRWVRDLPQAAGPLDRCTAQGGGPLVACTVGEPSAAVVHVDLADGALTATTPVPDGLVDWAVLDGDLVLAAREPGRLVVVRAAPGAAALDRGAPGVRWRVSLPLPGEREGALMLGVGDGLVVVRGGLGAALGADDGTLLGAWAPEQGADRVDVVVGPDGFGVWSSPQRGRWFDRSGTPVARIPGDPVTERVTDGSAPEVVLSLSPLLTAIDVGSGRVLWQRGDGGYLQPSTLPLRLDGTVVVPERDRLLGLDVRTGRVRWTAPGPAATQTLASRPLTDGRRLVVTDLDEAGSLVLRAIDLVDGADVWTVPAPPSARWVYGLGGRGVMQGGGDLVVLD